MALIQGTFVGFCSLRLSPVSHSQQPSHAPSHTIGAGLGLLTLRVDYMGSSIVMQRLDKVNIRLSDEWKLAEMTGVDTSHSRCVPSLAPLKQTIRLGIVVLLNPHMGS